MDFSVTNDGVLYLYPYYTLDDKEDEMSKEVYHVFKRNWSVNQYLPGIYDDLYGAIESYGAQYGMLGANTAITVMPSHARGQYGVNLLKVAEGLAEDFGFTDESYLIQRTVDKMKSTEGGERSVPAHLATLGLAHELNSDIDWYIILDDITTTGSSLEAAKQLLIENDVFSRHIIKMAIAKTTHEDD